MPNKHWLIAIIIMFLSIIIPYYVYGADTWEESFDWSDTILQVNSQDVYVWEPKKDITPYEIALLLPIFAYVSQGSAVWMIETLPPEARRHFRKDN